MLGQGGDPGCQGLPTACCGHCGHTQLLLCFLESGLGAGAGAGAALLLSTGLRFD